MSDGQEVIVYQLDKDELTCSSARSDRFVFSYYFKPITLAQVGEEPDPNDVSLLQKLLESELGYLFLDRTRITPRGFAIGEHVESLSMAPGEEVVVEQKSFSKRETTFEEQTEQEKQFDLEMSSTLSTELAEGLDRESSKTDTTGFTAGGSVGGNIKGVDVKADASYSRTVTEANSQARKRSVKDSSTASQKVASKYRAMHKTTFKVSTEDRFELTSKRVLKNPNQYSSLDLHYFKVLQRLELAQERYGVRLCWAPAIKDPASDLLIMIEKRRQDLIAQAISNVQLPPKPEPPPKENKPPRQELSAVKEADQWQVNGGMSADYDLPISIPAGYVWNGDKGEVKRLTQVWGRPSDNMWWDIVGTPYKNNDDGTLVVRVHVGCKGWVGGPKVFMQAKATFIADPQAEDAAYKQAYQAWLAEVDQWEADVLALQEAPRKKAEAEAEAWQRAFLAQLDPVAELMDQIAKKRFLPTMTDEAWEVEFWREIFDWDEAGFGLAPSWWASEPTRDALRGASDFLNASWARLYLPVKPGFERLALRWIIGKVLGQTLDQATEEAFATVSTQLGEFREQSFGDAAEIPIDEDSAEIEEKYLTLAHWTELLPTDGTHVEVVQGMTSAVDSHSASEIQSERQLRNARLVNEEQDVELKKRAVAQIPQSAKDKLVSYNIAIGTEEPEDSNGR